ncbi:MAG: DUF6737 family protein [Cyanobacteria bacterium P01_D01_bin.105]
MDKTNTSMWAIKPWWCQPWSIVLTGLAIPLGSWRLLHLWWITLPVSAVIAVWWVLFLGIVPAQYAAAVLNPEETYPEEASQGEQTHDQ